MMITIYSRNLLAIKANKSESPALLGAVILGDVGVANAAVLLEETLQVVRGGPVAQAVHLQADHLGDVRRRTLTTPSTAAVSVRHL